MAQNLVLENPNSRGFDSENKDAPTHGEDNGKSQDTPEPAVRMQYRTEYRDIYGTTLHSEQGDKPLSEPQPVSQEPPFEAVNIYTVRTARKSNDSDSTTTFAAGIVPPTRLLRIFSLAIINAIQSVVQYYPSQDLSGDTVEVRWPYPILVHHYDELAKFADQCAAKEKHLLCDREKDAPTHIRILLEYLDRNIMDAVRTEQERNRSGFYTFDWYWVGCRPGVTVLQAMKEDKDVENIERLVVHTVTGGIFTYPPSNWVIEFWRMEFDGTCLGRTLRRPVIFDKFDGESNLGRGSHMIVGYGQKLDYKAQDADWITELIEQGRAYWNLLRKQCRFHVGKSHDFPYNKVEGHVMVDVEGYYAQPEFTAHRPTLLENNDLRTRSSSCQCSVCKDRAKKLAGGDEHAFFADYLISLGHQKELTDHQALLCPYVIPAFVFQTHTWEKLHVSNIKPPRFDKTLIDNLVMDPRRLKTLKALAKRFARLTKDESEISEGPWTADFVKGKGNGLIFLLHGKPGVGKTCTAECISEFTQRPLMVLTSSDIGTDSITAERNLKREFKKAKSWGAVLLIDEADVFLQERNIRDLTRNTLVAGFLRALEFFDGILFLTTNRVGVFDDAFMSRVHVKLHYPDFDDKQREQIWQTFVNKLAKERSGDMRLHPDAKYYLKGKEVRSMKWNGREIRNAFQTAVSLAEYDAEKDEEGKTVVTEDHLKAVVELSKDFQLYLDDLHKGNESKRAERKGERLDSFAGADSLD